MCTYIRIYTLPAIMCPNLLPLADGIITFTGDMASPFDYQTTATYSCDPGYGLSGGDRVRTCVASSLGGGEWSGSAPICQS